jgi:hypothetical protein
MRVGVVVGAGMFRRHISLVLAACYLAGIPLFAIAYYAVRTEFYHVTVQYEPSMTEDAHSLEAVLEKAIADNYASHTGRETYEDDRYTLDVRHGLSVGELQATRTDLQFRVEIELHWKGSQNETFAWFMASMPGEGLLWVDDRTYPRFLTVTWPGDPVIDIAPVFPFDCYQARCGTRLVADAEVNREIESWWRAMNGFPAGASLDFERMLYLSAITITTVGYGDIVPLSPWTRTLVATEAVYGVVVAGMFLASLALASRRRTG